MVSAAEATELTAIVAASTPAVTKDLYVIRIKYLP